MAKYETNKQWTTYRILDATIDNADLADPLNLGATGAGAGKGFILWGDTSAAKIEWEEDNDRLLTTSATIRMGTDDHLEFRDAGKYIYSFSAGQISIESDGTSPSAILLNANTHIGGYLRLQDTATPGTSGGQLWYDSVSDQKVHYFDNSNALTLLDHRGGQTLVGSMTFATNNKLYFRDTGQYIQSSSTNQLLLYSDGTTPTAIFLNANTALGGYLRLHDTNVAGTSGGQVWFDSVTTQKLHYFDGSNDLTVVDTRSAQTFLDDITIDSDKKLYFRDTGQYIQSSSTNQLLLYSDGTTSTAIFLNANTALGGYLRLLDTATPGTSQGQLWYDSVSDRKIHYFDNVNALTLIDHRGGQTFIGDMTMQTDTKLIFRDANKYIYSFSAGQISIECDGTSPSAILLNANTHIGGYLRLVSTAAVDGTSNGQIWYDSNTNELRAFKNGAAVNITTT